MMGVWFGIIFLLACSYNVDSARILGIFPLPGKSHYFLGSALMKALAEKGHDVTMVTCNSETQPRKGKYREIILKDVKEEADGRMEKMDLYEFGEGNPFITVPFMAHMLSDLAVYTLRDKKFQELIHSGEKFDAVILEQFFHDAHKSLATHFGAVQIVFSLTTPNFWISPLVGNPIPPAYVPDTLSNYGTHMSFFQRVTNTLITLLNAAVHQLYLYPKFSGIAQQYIPNAPNFDEVLYNVSLVLLNSHPSLNHPSPLVPTMKEIVGFHISPPKKLPSDLQQFLDGAKDGVIYFSMGSNLKSSKMSPEKRDAFIKVFSKLKQKVLWKWEDDVLPGKPSNVKIGKWLPQQSILAHPNVKLFITHGGLLSTTETVYFGKPVLAIPIFGDQKLNAQTTINYGYGLMLPYKELCEESLEKKLDQLLNNPKYYANAVTRSTLFHDRPIKPIDEAIYWVEYVIRHKGAPHLRVAALQLSWYQYFLLDVFAFIGAVLFAGFLVLWFALKKICQKKTNKLKKN